MAAEAPIVDLWLLAVWISSFLSGLLMSFDRLSIGGFIFPILIGYDFFLYVGNINPLSAWNITRVGSFVLYSKAWEGVCLSVCLCRPTTWKYLILCGYIHLTNTCRISQYSREALTAVLFRKGCWLWHHRVARALPLHNCKTTYTFSVVIICVYLSLFL